jgi:hypothetical protein
MEDDRFLLIATHHYGGVKGCMGYPERKAGHARAEVWFKTPETLGVPDAVDYVYLCKECWATFMEVIAVGVIFAE